MTHYWEMISDKLSREGFSVGWGRFTDDEDRDLWCADASRDGKRWIVYGSFKRSSWRPATMPAVSGPSR